MSQLWNQGLESLLRRPDITRDTLSNNTFGVALVPTSDSAAATTSGSTAASIVVRSSAHRATAAAVAVEMGGDAATCVGAVQTAQSSHPHALLPKQSAGARASPRSSSDRLSSPYSAGRAPSLSKRSTRLPSARVV
jgi:hypothetical protein